ncbi:hypothetical protein PCANC_17352 [Puccinia coronata f. sp. avenae]|uniref:Uncharacterized protein n=1 Tax=Puccinia coronata f. sp. avenae TaxID=200324 RepID=A0A2N5U4X1_9BASI|nr:hypothetical protein PCANC_17352 [Puccinia coronata f. sp. avenae]
MPLEVKSPLTYHPGALFAAPSSPVFPSPFELEDLHGHNELYNNDEDYKEAEVVTVPVLTGSMANSINKGFVLKYDLKTRQHKTTI